MKQYLSIVAVSCILSACGQNNVSFDKDGCVIEGKGSQSGRSSFTSISPIQTISGEVSRGFGTDDASDILRQTSVIQGQQTTIGLSSNLTTGSGGQDQLSGDGSPLEDLDDRYIAYTYSLSLELPQAGVRPLISKHIAACEAAGPSVCIVTSTDLTLRSDRSATSYVYLMAVPDWIEAFNASLDSDLAEANGIITSRGREQVDLTDDFLDIDARLSAKITLQKRLEELLANEAGGLGELLLAERELADVIGEVESITTSLKTLQKRVTMSEFDINYRGLVKKERPKCDPIKAASKSFFTNLAKGVGSLISSFAFGLPWIVLTGFFIFAWVRAIWPFMRRS